MTWLLFPLVLVGALAVFWLLLEPFTVPDADELAEMYPEVEE